MRYRPSVASLLFNLGVRALNAGLGALIGFAMSASRAGRWVARNAEVEHDTVILVATVAIASVGFIWGAKLWSMLDRNVDGGWTRRGP